MVICFSAVLALSAAELSIKERVAEASRKFTGKPLRARGDSAQEEEQASILIQIYDDARNAYEAARLTDNPPLRKHQIKLEWAKELDAFLDKYPGSPFDADICLQLGKEAYMRGAYVRAMSKYREAWDATKNNPDGDSPAMAREASSTLARLLALTGQTQAVLDLNEEAHNLDFSTHSPEWNWANAINAIAIRQPKNAFECGFTALHRLQS